jgi:hypothetical protein
MWLANTAATTVSGPVTVLIVVAGGAVAVGILYIVVASMIESDEFFWGVIIFLAFWGLLILVTR